MYHSATCSFIPYLRKGSTMRLSTILARRRRNGNGNTASKQKVASVYTKLVWAIRTARRIPEHDAGIDYARFNKYNGTASLIIDVRGETYVIIVSPLEKNKHGSEPKVTVLGHGKIKKTLSGLDETTWSVALQLLAMQLTRNKPEFDRFA